MRDKIVYIDEAVDVEEAGGGRMRSWLPWPGFFWASIKPLKGRELATNAANLSIMDTLITFGWSPKLSTASTRHRIRYGSTIYDIVSVADDRMAHIEIEMMCLSGAEQG